MRIIRIAMLCAVVFLLAASPVFAADESDNFHRLGRSG